MTEKARNITIGHTQVDSGRSGESTGGPMKRSAALGLAVLFGVPASAQSAQSLVTGTSTTELVGIARGFGSASLGTSSATGSPKITGRIGGQEYSVYFYGCDSNKKNCTSIQFATYWIGKRLTAAEVNQWNADKRFGKLFIDSDGDLNLQMDVNLDFGVTYKNMEDTFDLWKLVLEDVLDAI
ncbi:YbjN domain-containing protein [Deinococcus wulumuqiensis R12]|uniref:YbjN domain-containing protein n=2 Tax=Deinococcus wulumuqiensis TaxID=980427 RepID=A0A345IIZ6_9DEIO|nr:YbjN domain-containing protein [Deinococcus wulumuqiensis]QII21226.1 YbjN domain-containing protein [Deinococcus wulumuqiensis R12]